MKRVPFILLSLFLISCQGNESQNQLSQISQELLSLRLEVSMLKITATSMAASMAELDPTQKSFSVVMTNNGHLLMSCEDIQPYGDGQKLTLRIGNPYDMTYSGFSLTCRYGTRPPEVPAASDSTSAMLDWLIAHRKWRETLKEAKKEFGDKLYPGSWNKVF